LEYIVFLLQGRNWRHASMGILVGKSAIVTGAARGIGRAIAEEFYAQGANVLLTDINEQLGALAAADIDRGKSNRALFKRMDVTKEQDVRAAFSFAISQFGLVDIVVNNAAVLIAHEVKDFPVEEWQRVFDVNMTGAFLCAKTGVNIMVEKNVKGCILNISSAAARKADQKHAAYSASKAAMICFARVLALEVGKYGIRVNSILPGATETEMLSEVCASVDGLRDEIKGKTVLGRLGQPKDQANAAVFLCSDRASHITGEYLVVSGGEFFNA
jgi:NAD(P)-dependent dehydrogenase (short-subunit alcohol dehydrogenase family)